MRIIGGRFRGKKLEYISDATTRPTKDSVREGVFNILGKSVLDANVLDLFAGSGAYGIEALSRGAAHVTFNDTDINAVNVIKKNVSSVNAQNFQILNHDYLVTLNKLKGQKFDIVFLDPPYNAIDSVGLINLLDSHELLTDKSIIVLESASDKVDVDLSQNFDIKTKHYGKTIIDIIKKIPTDNNV